MGQKSCCAKREETDNEFSYNTEEFTQKTPDGIQITGRKTEEGVVGNVTFEYPSGSKYEGQISKGKKEGTGTFIWKDGKSYSGGYLNDLKHGYGVYTTKNKIYQGNWHNGQKHGKGKELNKADNSLIREGIWQNGIFYFEIQDLAFLNGNEQDKLTKKTTNDDLKLSVFMES